MALLIVISSMNSNPGNSFVTFYPYLQQEILYRKLLLNVTNWSSDNVPTEFFLLQVVLLLCLLLKMYPAVLNMP